MSRRTETSYKAESPGETAQHVKALDSGDTVNGAVVQWKFTFLSGETCFQCGFESFLLILLGFCSTARARKKRETSDL